MRDQSKSHSAGNTPSLVISSGTASAVSDGFTMLTGYPSDEILGMSTEDIMSTLRVQKAACDRLFSTGRAECYLFTKTLEPREVTISLFSTGTDEKYIFEEIPNTRLEDVLGYPCQLLYENLIGVSIYSAPDFTLLKANQTYLDFCDKPFNIRENTIGRVIDDFIPGYRGSPAERSIANIFVTGKSEILRELQFDSFERGVTYWNQIITPVKINGKIKYVVTNTQEVTDKVIAKQRAAQQESEARLRAVLENSNDLIYCRDMLTGRYDYVSPACATVLGFSPEEYMAMDAETLLAMIHPDDLPAYQASFSNLEKTGRLELKYRLRTKSGMYRWFSNRLSVVKDTAGQVLRRYGNIHDITDQVNNDEVLRNQAILLQNITDIIISIDFNQVITSWNKAAERTYGWTEEEAVGQHIGTLLQVQLPDNSYEVEFSRLMAEGRIEAEAIHTCRDGRKLNILCAPSVIKDSSGRITGIIGVFHDITERKKTEEALRARDTHLRLAAEGASLGAFTRDVTLSKISWLYGLETLWGIQPDSAKDMDEKDLFAMLHPDDKKEFIQKYRASVDPCGDGVLDVDFRVAKPDGTVRWLHVRAMTTFSANGADRHPLLTAGIVIDITERVAAEHNAREVSEELSKIIESTDDYIFSVDRDYRLIFCNSSFYDYVLNQFGRRLVRGVLMEAVFASPNAHVWTDALAQAARDGKIQFESKIANGTRVMSFSLNPVYIDSELVEITVFGKDITARINSEREIIRLNASLEKSVLERTSELRQTVKTLQDLSGIISHDLKTHLREIEKHIGNIEKTDENKLNVEKISKSCVSMTKMIDDLTQYAMSSDMEIRKETVNIKKIIISVYNDLKAAATNRSVIHFETGLPLVLADNVLIRHVLFNIMSNALKFTSKKEIAEITVGCREEHDEYVFYITDNGVGFNMRHAHKLFKVFTRLHSKADFEGTGIGLAAVHNIIQRHGGRTWIESQTDIGTTVYFTLPVAADS